MQRPGEIEDLKKKIHARARKVLYHTIGNFVWARGSGRGEVEAAAKNSAGEKGAKGQVTHLRARGSAELKSGSLWLCYAEPLAEKWKSGIAGKRHRPKPTPWEKNS